MVARVRVTELYPAKRRARFACICAVEGKPVLEGEAVLMGAGATGRRCRLMPGHMGRVSGFRERSAAFEPDPCKVNLSLLQAHVIKCLRSRALPKTANCTWRLTGGVCGITHDRHS